jgi:hypothetical protein
MKMTGTIRKWVVPGCWGIVNSYSNGGNAPERFFVHIKNAQEGRQLDAGVRITFEPGPVRRKGDLPTALNIELAPTQPSSSAAAVSAKAGA